MNIVIPVQLHEVLCMHNLKITVLRSKDLDKSTTTNVPLIKFEYRQFCNINQTYIYHITGRAKAVLPSITFLMMS